MTSRLFRYGTFFIVRWRNGNVSPSRLRLTANGTLYDKEVVGSSPALTTMNFKFFFILILCLIIGLIAFKVVFISRAINSGKTLYQIDVNTYKHGETYITEKYIVDPKTKCISFKDEMGIKRIVCDGYTITEY